MAGCPWLMGRDVVVIFIWISFPYWRKFDTFDRKCATFIFIKIRVMFIYDSLLFTWGDMEEPEMFLALSNNLLQEIIIKI